MITYQLMYQANLHFHFTGIGGSGMSGLAEILINLGYAVSGSDLSESAATTRLKKIGAQITLGHSAEALPAATSMLVYSSAVSMNNPEVLEAKRRGLPLVRRAEILAELMRLKYGVAVAGSHGKTTTTSLVAAIMEQGGLDPTVVIGGKVKSSGTGAKLGKGQYLVAESDESDRSFLLLKPTLAIVTNIDAEHMSAYKSLEDLEGAFAQFVSAVPFYGLAILCVDDAKVRSLANAYSGRKLTYGFSPDAELRAVNLSHRSHRSFFDLYYKEEKLGSIELAMPGRHMVSNSLAAIAVGLEFGIPIEKIATALKDFSGVERRLEILGQTQGITVMNDYGHHPAEIRATIRAVKDGWGAEISRLIVIFQPHRYSRTRDCFAEFIEAFVEADKLFMLDIYSAGEDPIEGVSGKILSEAISHKDKSFVESTGDMFEQLAQVTKAGDMLLFLGAGSIGSISHQFLQTLIELKHVSEAALSERV
jgi:UDP-N-acetylmuramate--alanine ligase